MNFLKKIKNIFSMGKIIINGKSYDNIVGNNIQIINDKVMVNGVVIESGLSGIVQIKFEGDLANLNATNVQINGNVNGKVDSTNLKVSGDIKGDVDCTHLDCRDIIANKVDAVHIKCNSKK